MRFKNFKILDIAKTEYGYLQLGHRVREINSLDMFENSILLPAGYSDKLFLNDGVKVFHENGLSEFRPSLVYLSNIITRIACVLTEYKPSIVHTHSSKVGLVGRIAARKAHIPFVIHQVHGFGYKRLDGMKRFLLEKLEEHLSRKCDLMLFQNKEDIETAREWRSSAKLFFIGNGIDFNEFKPRKVFVPPKDCTTMEIAYVGRQDKNKNLVMAFRALEQIGSTLDTRLHVFGEGQFAHENKLYVDNSEILKNRVVFHGNVDRIELSERMKEVHVCLLCSKQEGNPRVVMEASYLGIPTVGTDVVGTRESLIDGVNGFLVPYNDHNAMARIIVQLYEDRGLWLDISNRSREYAKKYFDERKVIEKLRIIYESIVNSKIDSLIFNTNGGLNNDWI